MVRSYKAGDVVLEPTDTPMQAFNPGAVQVSEPEMMMYVNPADDPRKKK